MKKHLLLCSVLCAALFSSCKNELDVTDDYRETMVIYGLLSPSDTAQYIKINKAFLGRADAYDMAAQYDSFNYVNNEISAHLERWNNGVKIGPDIALFKDSVIPKGSGSFAYPGQVLYKTNVPIVQDGSEYKLYVTNENSGKIISSSTTIVQPMTVSIPLNNQTINIVGNVSFKSKWFTARNGRLYNLVVRMHYTERFVFDTLQVADKFIDLTFTDVRSTTLDGGEPLEQQVIKDNFFRNIRNHPAMDANLQKERFFKSLEFRYSVAAEEFTTYMDVASTSGSSFGDNPFYTNINGGVGLFSSRYTRSVINVGLTNASKDTLRNGQFTYDLRFQ